MRRDPVPPDSDATKLALLPARIAFWKKFSSAADHVARLEAELAEVERRLAAQETKP